ncbi:conserved oligomeric Golgi complex subunit 2-like protein [Euroglyphus maynei]|uniref:Conserved oligomeric Golgi complex subunit 2 n=1 Tax=Euroglyphus maynei TaxID=6958 RepID=A0A1Y3BII3_EURMA|nr:conserved oligomeric Golgi complex subunit 2-like protein [Euroglyphus maynei]
MNGKHLEQSSGHHRETFIPDVPEYYCFVGENFLSETFSVDGFVRRNSKRVQSLETMKEHLSAYLKLLKQAMVNLINEDYTEFVNLSANLVSFDKLIQNIKTPVLKFKNETDHTGSKINETIESITAKQDRLKKIRENKRKLSMILEIIDYLDRIETNHERIESKVAECPNDLKAKRLHIYKGLGENSTLICRLNINFDCLWSDSFLSKLRIRFERATQQFHAHLENELLFLLDHEQTLVDVTLALEQIFALYLIDGQNQKELERVIRTLIVGPCFQEIIDTSNQVATIFSRIIDLIENKWSRWINVLTTSKQFESFKFDLIISAFWNPFVELFLVRSPILLDLSDLDTFERNYYLTFEFVEQFVRKTAISDMRLVHRLSDRSIEECSLRNLLDEFVANFRSTAIDKVILLMRNEIVSECKVWLNQVDHIPRLYRRTNKEKPKEASSYVDKCVRQLVDCMEMLANENCSMVVNNTNNELLLDVLNDLTVHYKHSTLEVLTSVQRTEDSLKKLKKHKALNSTMIANQLSSMSDDDKIRLQIYYDVTTLGRQVSGRMK